MKDFTDGQCRFSRFVDTYRSFRNDPTPVGGDPQKALGLFFAEAEFRFETISDTGFKGVIDWGSGGLDLSGEIRPVTPTLPTPLRSLESAGRQPNRRLAVRLQWLHSLQMGRRDQAGPRAGRNSNRRQTSQWSTSRLHRVFHRCPQALNIGGPLSMKLGIPVYQDVNLLDVACALEMFYWAKPPVDAQLRTTAPTCRLVWD
jgi:hypothetical protein